MARIFKHQFTAIDKATGKRVKRMTSRWYIDYRDEHGKKQRVRGFVDKLATQRLATELEHNVILKLRGERPPEQSDFQHTPLSVHVHDYLEAMRRRNGTPRHLTQVRQILSRIFRETCTDFPDKLTRQRVETWLASARTGKRFSVSTSNHYLSKLHSFVLWMVHEKRLPADPLLGMKRLNPEPDRVRIRRALTEAEFGRLIVTTRKSPDTIRGVNGPDRAMLYQLAGYTGLRRSELLSLTPDSFSLDAELPTVTVEARHSKHRKRDVVPLPKWLADELRTWLAGRKPPLWSGAVWLKTAIMLRRDLKAAKIPATDAQGRVVDLHALRVFYITSLARAGVSLTFAQRLARHSSPILTANVYTSIEMDELAEAVSKLPKPK